MWMDERTRRQTGDRQTVAAVRPTSDEAALAHGCGAPELAGPSAALWVSGSPAGSPWGRGHVGTQRPLCYLADLPAGSKEGVADAKR